MFLASRNVGEGGTIPELFYFNFCFCFCFFLFFWNCKKITVPPRWFPFGITHTTRRRNTARYQATTLRQRRDAVRYVITDSLCSTATVRVYLRVRDRPAFTYRAAEAATVIADRDVREIFQPSLLPPDLRAIFRTYVYAWVPMKEKEKRNFFFIN